jgi:hypothetical protein
MKSKIETAFRGLLFAVLLTLFASTLMYAQEVKGSFNLPFEVYWGNVQMPAGHYTFNLDPTGVTPVVLQRGSTSNIVRYGFHELLGPSAKSQLIIVRAGDKWLVNAVYIPSVKKAFWFNVPQRYAVSHRVVASSQPTERLDFIPVIVNGQ